MKTIRESLCNRPLHAAPTRAGAFTLIELLVVVTIIAILASLVLPAVGVVRDASKGVVCNANLRQIGLGVTGYTLDHRGQMPPVKMDLPTGGVAWMTLVAPYIESENDGNRDGVMGWGEYSTRGVITCPIYKYKPTPWQPGYAMNNFLLWPESSSNNSVRADGTSYFGGTVINLLAARIPYRSTRLLVADTTSDENLWGSGDCSYRHRQRTGALFCDSHVGMLTRNQATIAIGNPAIGY